MPFIVYRQIVDETELDQLVINPAQQKLGFGKAALKAWHQYLVGHQQKKVILEVASSNSSALALYQGLGYQQIGIRKNYYQFTHGTYDALIMELAL